MPSVITVADAFAIAVVLNTFAGTGKKREMIGQSVDLRLRTCVGLSRLSLFHFFFVILRVIESLSARALASARQHIWLANLQHNPLTKKKKR